MSTLRYRRNWHYEVFFTDEEVPEQFSVFKTVFSIGQLLDYTESHPDEIRSILSRAHENLRTLLRVPSILVPQLQKRIDALRINRTDRNMLQSLMQVATDAGEDSPEPLVTYLKQFTSGLPEPPTDITHPDLTDVPLITHPQKFLDNEITDLLLSTGIKEEYGAPTKSVDVIFSTEESCAMFKDSAFIVPKTGNRIYYQDFKRAIHSQMYPGVAHLLNSYVLPDLGADGFIQGWGIYCALKLAEHNYAVYLRDAIIKYLMDACTLPMERRVSAMMIDAATHNYGENVALQQIYASTQYFGKWEGACLASFHLVGAEMPGRELMLKAPGIIIW